MQRRLFLAGAGGALTSLPLGALATPAAPSKDDVPLLRSYVTNQEQYPRAAAPEVDEILHLERTPNCQYNPASIAIIRQDGDQVGYLPPDSTAVLAVLLDEGVLTYAKVLPRGLKETAGVPLQIYWRRGTHKAFSQ